MRAQNASWATCARSCGVSEDLLRRHCDPGYHAPDLKEAAQRTPPLASGRENRPRAYEPPPQSRAPMPGVKPPPPASVAVASMPTAMQVAHVLVAAAKVLGEDAREAFEEALTPRRRRCRFIAFIVLRAAFPGCTVAALGRMAGIPTNQSTLVSKAQESSWWPGLGDRAIEAAEAALPDQAVRTALKG
jgi:hypothetical protein